jgi:hypothetical protein
VNLLPLILTVAGVAFRYLMSPPQGAGVFAQASSVLLAWAEPGSPPEAGFESVPMWALFPVAVLMLVGLPSAGVLILGGLKMRRLELYGLPVVASILAMMPCHLGFVLGLPIGLWALLVLSRAEVKAAFRHQRTLEAES